MKFAMLAALFSFSAMASECFVRQVEISSTKVSLAKEICVNKIDLKLELFGSSSAKLAYTLDGTQRNLTTPLRNATRLANGKVAFRVIGIDNDTYGGGCSETEEATATAVLTMNADGTDAKIEQIEGSVTENWDNCHGNPEEVQSFYYVKQ